MAISFTPISYIESLLFIYVIVFMYVYLMFNTISISNDVRVV